MDGDTLRPGQTMEMHVLELKVEGLTCGHCVNAVTEAVHSVAPQWAVAVDLQQGLVKITAGRHDNPDRRRDQGDRGGRLQGHLTEENGGFLLLLVTKGSPCLAARQVPSPGRAFVMRPTRGACQHRSNETITSGRANRPLGGSMIAMQSLISLKRADDVQAVRRRAACGIG